MAIEILATFHQNCELFTDRAGLVKYAATPARRAARVSADAAALYTALGVRPSDGFDSPSLRYCRFFADLSSTARAQERASGLLSRVFFLMPPRVDFPISPNFVLGIDHPVG